VAEKPEHPAAKAGRFVRAAGIVVGREIDRRAAAAAARPVPVKAPPPPPPPAAETETIVGKAMFGLFVTALAAVLATILHVAEAFHDTAQTTTRLVLAGIMFAEAYLVIGNWHGGSDRIAQRLLNRVWGPRGAMTRREKFFARRIRDILTLLGIAFAAAAVFQTLVAFFGI
jgi:hypothetical protein